MSNLTLQQIYQLTAPSRDPRRPRPQFVCAECSAPATRREFRPDGSRPFVCAAHAQGGK